MYTLQDIFDFVDYICNKEQTGNTLSPAEKNTILKFVNAEIFEYIYTRYEVNQKNTDSISPFKVVMGENNTPPLKIDALGRAELPSDIALQYIHKSALYSYYIKNNKDIVSSNGCSRKIINHGIGAEYKRRPIEILFDNQWAERLSSSLKAPDLFNPVCVFKNGYIQFEPKNLRYAVFHYLKFPRQPVYSVTINELDGTYSYDAANSVEFEYKDEDFNIIVMFILKHIGINLKENGVVQYAQLKSQEIEK